MEPLTTNSLCSISWKGLESLLSELQVPQLDLREFVLPPFNTHQLRPLLVARGIYPARDFPHLIARRLPDVFVTYDWRESVLAVRQTIGAALQHCVRSQADAFPNCDLDEVATHGVTFWLDWIFLDQSSRDVDEELDQVLPILFRESAVHVVASVTALTRAWCCYELAQFNRNASDSESAELASLIPGDLQDYPLWAGVASTDPADKKRVERRIVETFPGGLSSLERLMVQAGLAADLHARTAAASRHIAEASERWIQRFISE